MPGQSPRDPSAVLPAVLTGITVLLFVAWVITYGGTDKSVRRAPYDGEGATPAASSSR